MQMKEPKGNKLKSQAIAENLRDESNMQMIEQNPMEINNQKEYLNVEEQVMKHLLHAWRHLYKHFILEDQKQLYKETF